MLEYVSLNKNGDFLRIYRTADSCVKPSLVLYAKKNRVGVCRLGITTSKKIGCAVERNRSRRVIRAAFQSVMSERTVKENWDFVFVARTKTKHLKSTAVKADMLECMKKLGVLK